MSVLDGTLGDMVYLVRCALDGRKPDMARIDAMDLDAVYQASQRHLLVSACATALESAGVHDEQFAQAWAKAVRKVALMDAERASVCRAMDAAGIWYAPLKGCILKDLWPAFGMRQMADNDILFDVSRAEDVRDIMESKGFTSADFGKSNHDVYFKKPVYNFEMHRGLFGKAYEPRVYAYYQDAKRLLVPDGESTCGMHLRDEDFYVYLIAHEHKHFSAGGTGLRSLADTYVWLRAKSDCMDWDYMATQLDMLGLTDFERDNRLLTTALFSGEPLTQEQEDVLGYMADSGTYGTTSHKVSNQVARYGRMGYLVHRAVPPLEFMQMLYPVLESHPVLLPVCWVWRLASAVVTKPKRVREQLMGAFMSTRDET